MDQLNSSSILSTTFGITISPEVRIITSLTLLKMEKKSYETHQPHEDKCP